MENKNQEQIINLINELSNKLPKFPDGRIDYSKSNIAPVITVFIKYKDKILLLKRSEKVSTYKEKWNTVAGYIDEPIPIFKKIKEELREELGINENNIKSYHIGNKYEFTDFKINRKWIVYPALVEIKDKTKLKLDWEHTEYTWIRPDDLTKYDTVPNLELSLKKGLII